MSEHTDPARDVEAMLAGVRCQARHDQIVGASCVNCQSWAQSIGLPFWEPVLAAYVARKQAEALREAADARGERLDMERERNHAEVRAERAEAALERVRALLTEDGTR